MVRWKAFLPTVIVMTVVVLVFHFFLDVAVERAIEKAGTAANGAKVELDGVNISFLRLSVVLKRIQVTNSNEPMTNAVEIDRMVFNLAGKPLAWKKIVVENAAITGIRTGTPRRTSGALPEKKKSPDQKTEESVLAKIKEESKAAANFAVGNLKEQYDPKKLLNLEGMASFKKIQEEKTRFAGLSDAWKTRLDGLDAKKNADEVKAYVEKIKSAEFSGLEGVRKAKELLEEGKRVRENLDITRKEFSNVKNALQSEINQTKNALKSIDDLKKEDINGALGNLKAGFSAEGITRGLIGSAWQGKIYTALGWFRKIKGMVPAKKSNEGSPPPPPKREGRDIPFPFKYDWPAFWLKKAALSGSTNGGLDYSGELKNVSSKPETVPPINLFVEGRKEPEKLKLRVSVDLNTHLKKAAVPVSGRARDYVIESGPSFLIDAGYEGLSLAGVSLGRAASSPVRLGEGRGNLSASLDVVGEQIKGHVKFTADPVKLEMGPSEKSGDKLQALLRNILARLNRFDVTFEVSDTVTSPNIKIQTSLDKDINKALQESVKKELDEIRAKFQTRADELVDAEKKKLEDVLRQKTNGLTDQLGQKEGALKSVEDQLQKAMNDLKGKALPGLGGGTPSLPKLKGIFK